jgi:hypothetical protein
MRTFKIPRSSLNKAITDNTVYYKYRWVYIEEGQDQTIVKAEPTKECIVKNNGYIAKLNKDRTKILNVYLDRKTASIKNNYKCDYLDSFVKYGNIVDSKYYYVLYENCSKEVKEEFLKSISKSEIVLSKTPIGKYENDVLVKIYKSKYNCCVIENQIGQKSLENALNNGIKVYGYTYKNLEEIVMY